MDAINFAKKHSLKLVIKGTGHDYLGRSNAPGSLLVWTHQMRGISMHDAFVPQGAPRNAAGIPAVTIEAGARWGEVYREVIAKHGRYVQGGGCPSVGAVGGFLQGGGFGSFSKKYGMGASNLLEVKLSSANGERDRDEWQQIPPVWALKGGGGGTFGIVAKATLQTHALPNYVGFHIGKISAKSDEAFKELLEYFINFYREKLNYEHWGEQITIKPDNSIILSLCFQGFTQEEAENIWVPFRKWISRSDSFSMESNFLTCPAKNYWDYPYLAKNYPDSIKKESNSTQEDPLFYWSNNQHEVGAFWLAYHSRWLPAALFDEKAAQKLATVLFEASRHHEYSLHFNKGLAGALLRQCSAPEILRFNPSVSNQQL